MDLRQRVLNALNRHKLTQRNFAQTCGLSGGTIGYICRGSKTKLNSDTIAKVEYGLRVLSGETRHKTNEESTFDNDRALGAAMAALVQARNLIDEKIKMINMLIGDR